MGKHRKLGSLPHGNRPQYVLRAMARATVPVHPGSVKVGFKKHGAKGFCDVGRRSDPHRVPVARVGKGRLADPENAERKHETWSRCKNERTRPGLEETSVRGKGLANQRSPLPCPALPQEGCSRICCLTTPTVHGTEQHGRCRAPGQLIGRRVIHNIALIGLKPQNLAFSPFLPSGSGMPQGIERFCGFFRCLWCEVACLLHQLAHLKPAFCSQPFSMPCGTMLQHRRSKGAFS